MATSTREDTRRRLLDAAHEVFSAVGFQAATIGEVCARAGFTRGAFYSNFTSLDELLLGLWERSVVATTAALREEVAAVDAADEPFERALGAVIALRAPDRASFLLSIELLLHAMRTPGLEARVEQARDRFRAELVVAVEALLRAEGRRPPDGIDLETFTELLIAGQLGCQQVTATQSPEPDIALGRAMVHALVAACPLDEGAATPTD